MADRVAAHIDLMPTILEACGVPLPAGVAIDGRSVLPLLEGRAEGWPERTLVIQAHRGDVPVAFHNVAVRTQRWKLVSPSGFDREVAAVEPRFELFDMQGDPFETDDVAAAHPDVVAALRTEYERHWASIVATRPDAFAPPRICVGTDAEPTTTLTRQDWRRVDGERGWGARGVWRVDVRRAGTYAVTLRVPRQRQGEVVEFTCGEVRHAVAVPRGAATVAFEVDLPAGPAAVRTVLRDAAGEYGAHQVDIALRPQ